MTCDLFPIPKLNFHHERSNFGPFGAILPHLVPLMGDPMTPHDFFSVMDQGTNLLTTDFCPYHDFICSLDCYRNDFCYEDCNFAHFDPIGGLHARPLDPSLPFFGHDGLQQLTQVPFQFDSGWPVVFFAFQNWIFTMNEAILGHFAPLGALYGWPHDPSWFFFCHASMYQVTNY